MPYGRLTRRAVANANSATFDAILLHFDQRVLPDEVTVCDRSCADLDDQMSGYTVTNNTFEDCQVGVFIGASRGFGLAPILVRRTVAPVRFAQLPRFEKFPCWPLGPNRWRPEQQSAAQHDAELRLSHPFRRPRPWVLLAQMLPELPR